MQLIWLKNDNCLLAMRAAGAIVECMISIFPPLTPDFPALWLKSLRRGLEFCESAAPAVRTPCRPGDRHAGPANVPKYRAGSAQCEPATFARPQYCADLASDVLIGVCCSHTPQPLHKALRPHPAGRAHTAAIIRYRLPVSSRHPALFFLSSARTHTRPHMPGIR